MSTTYTQLHLNRKAFMNANKNNDHFTIDNNSNILISAPHGVSQIRLGKYKAKEIGSITTALYLCKTNNTDLIAKTQSNNDDANWDEISDYKESIRNIVNKNKTKYLIDIHGLSSKRSEDINLGIHLGKNIEYNISAFDNLYNRFIKENFIVCIDKPFMAGHRTISRS